MKKPTIILANDEHLNQAVVSLSFEKEKTFYLTLPYKLKEQFKKLEGAWWHPKIKQWSALDTEEEFIKIYRQCDNKKHQIILKLMYGCGLCRDEVCSLKTEDVSIDRELIFVKG